MLGLNTPISQLFMVGPIYAAKLKRLGIATVGDLLFHLPFRYENYSQISTIRNLHPGDKISVSATLTAFDNIYTKFGKKIQKAKITDETGEIEVIWYNQPYLGNVLRPGMKVSLSGEVKWFGHKLVFESPEYEIVRPGAVSIHTGRLVPIYPETEGVSSKWLRSRINAVLTKLSPLIPESLPVAIIEQFKLITRRDAVYFVHFPSNFKQIEEAKRRLSFDELLTLQLASDIRKKELDKKKVGNKFEVDKYKEELNNFIQNLPFKLTQAQEKVTAEILSDLAKIKPMNRLLEGDVGSGKTVVAAVAMYMTYLNGFQSVLMAPTEILANQHYQTIKTLLEPYSVKVYLLTGTSKKLYSSNEVRSSRPIKSGSNNTNSIDIYIGTHALLSEKLAIKKLGLVIIDEQQRFGVEQRAIMREKGDNPHVLILTATPIPRTIALTLYSDLDLSIIDEMPKGRIRVKTWVVPNEKRDAAYTWIKKQIENSDHKEPAFIICPFIEESESLDTVKAATTEYKRLKTEIFPKLRLGLLHGKLTAKQKQEVMTDMKEGKTDILVSTPVVEVGIDIPRATIMMIEAADRFGLSQLHQLRGRVGRGNRPSFCLLFTETENTKTIDRLKLLEITFSGPKLAEYDLQLRGAGEIWGTQQHGHFGLKFADLTDLVLIEETKEAANNLLRTDPNLSQVPLLKEQVQKYTIGNIAPD